MNDLTIIVATHNSPGWIRHCLECIHKYTKSHHRVIVVDNGSKPEVVKMLENMGEKRYIDFMLANPTNLGSHYAWNQGLNYVETEYAVIIHSDCLVSPNWDSTLLECMKKDENIKACSPTTNYADQFYLRYSQLFFDDYVKIKPDNKKPLDYEDIGYLLDDYYMFDNSFEDFSKKVFDKFHYSFRFLSEMGTHCVMFDSESLASLDNFDSDFYPHFGAEKVLLQKMNNRGWDYISCLGAYVHHHGNATSDGPKFSMPLMLEKSEKLAIKKIKSL